MNKYITLPYKEYLELIKYKEAIEELDKGLRRASKYFEEDKTEIKVYDTPKIFKLLECEYKVEEKQWLKIYRSE